MNTSFLFIHWRIRKFLWSLFKINKSYCAAVTPLILNTRVALQNIFPACNVGGCFLNIICILVLAGRLMTGGNERSDKETLRRPRDTLSWPAVAGEYRRHVTPHGAWMTLARWAADIITVLVTCHVSRQSRPHSVGQDDLYLVLYSAGDNFDKLNTTKKSVICILVKNVPPLLRLGEFTQCNI